MTMSGVDVLRLGPEGGLPVPKVPVIANDLPIGVRRAAGVKLQGPAGFPAIGAARVRHRGGAIRRLPRHDQHPHRVDIGIFVRRGGPGAEA